MRYCKRFSLVIFMLFCLGAYAGEGGVSVKEAKLTPVDHNYQLDASFDISFHPDLVQAMHWGAPIHFLVDFELVVPRRYWLDEGIVHVRKEAKLQYHVLSRQYLLFVDGARKSFTTLDQVRGELQVLRNWFVMDRNQIKGGEDYQAELWVRLDASQLANLLPTSAQSADKWVFVSKTYRWEPVLIK